MKVSSLNDLVDNNGIVKGRWVLSQNHTIRYYESGKKEYSRFDGSLIAAEARSLIFAVTEKEAVQKSVASLLELTGVWQLNQKNQITFRVDKGDGKKDVLVFVGSWSVGRHHELVYAFEEISSKSGRKESKELVFKGYWEATAPGRLIYYLGAGPESIFKFKGAFRSKYLLADDGQLLYDTKTVIQQKARKKTIALYGKWHVLRDLEISFEMEYDGQKKRTMVFDGDYRLDKNKSVRVRLKNQVGKLLGLELILTKDFLKTQNEAFLKFSKSIEEHHLEGGMRFRW